MPESEKKQGETGLMVEALVPDYHGGLCWGTMTGRRTSVVVRQTLTQSAPQTDPVLLSPGSASIIEGRVPTECESKMPVGLAAEASVIGASSAPSVVRGPMDDEAELEFPTFPRAAASSVGATVPDRLPLEAYTIEDRDRDAVLEFLGRDPELSPLLDRAAEKITKFFGAVEISLSLASDPESSWHYLSVLIRWKPHMTLASARERLSKFDREWWVGAGRSAGDQVCIDLGF